MTPAEFEESRRRQIAIAKLRALILSSVRITDEELKLEYAARNDGSMKKFEDERNDFISTLQEEKSNAVFMDWFRTLQNTVKVKIFTENLKRL